MMISSQEWELYEDPTVNGAHFHFSHPKHGGKRVLVIGTRSKEPRFHLEQLLHEIMEIMLEADRKRFCDGHTAEQDHSRYLFVFDHDWLMRFGEKFLTALLTSGKFEIKGG